MSELSRNRGVHYFLRKQLGYAALLRLNKSQEIQDTWSKTLETLNSADLTLLLGPAGAGKGRHLGLLHDHAHALGISNIKRISSETTRERRLNNQVNEFKDPQYKEYWDITQRAIRTRLLGRFRSGTIFQAAVHRHSKEVYFTDVNEFTRQAGEPESRHIWEVTARESIKLKNDGMFPKLKDAIVVVPVNGETWWREWNGRDGDKPDDYYVGRLKEARESYRTALCELESNGIRPIFVTNNYGDISESPQEYNPSMEIPPMYASMAAALNGGYSTLHNLQSRYRCMEVYRFAGQKLREEYGVIDEDDPFDLAITIAMYNT